MPQLLYPLYPLNRKVSGHQSFGGQKIPSRSSFFCGVTQRRLVVTDVSGKLFGPILKDCLTLENRTDKFELNVGNSLPISGV